MDPEDGPAKEWSCLHRQGGESESLHVWRFLGWTGPLSFDYMKNNEEKSMDIKRHNFEQIQIIDYWSTNLKDKIDHDQAAMPLKWGLSRSRKWATSLKPNWLNFSIDSILWPDTVPNMVTISTSDHLLCQGSGSVVSVLSDSMVRTWLILAVKPLAGLTWICNTGTDVEYCGMEDCRFQWFLLF